LETNATNFLPTKGEFASSVVCLANPYLSSTVTCRNSNWVQRNTWNHSKLLVIPTNRLHLILITGNYGCNRNANKKETGDGSPALPPNRQLYLSNYVIRCPPLITRYLW